MRTLFYRLQCAWLVLPRGLKILAVLLVMGIPLSWRFGVAALLVVTHAAAWLAGLGRGVESRKPRVVVRNLTE